MPTANEAALLYPDDRFYRGDINRKFQRHGAGSMHSADGAVQQMGEWRKDVFRSAAPAASLAQAAPAAPAASAPLAAAAPEAAATAPVAAPGASAASASPHRIPWLGGFYEGELNAQQQPHGQGALFRSNGKERACGQWADGKLHGLGRRMNSDSSVYEGEFIANQCSGLGIKRAADGRIACGVWVDNSLVRSRPVPRRKIPIGSLLSAAGEWLLPPHQPLQ